MRTIRGQFAGTKVICLLWPIWKPESIKHKNQANAVQWSTKNVAPFGGKAAIDSREREREREREDLANEISLHY